MQQLYEQYGYINTSSVLEDVILELNHLIDSSLKHLKPIHSLTTQTVYK